MVEFSLLTWGLIGGGAFLVILAILFCCTYGNIARTFCPWCRRKRKRVRRRPGRPGRPGMPPPQYYGGTQRIVIEIDNHEAKEQRQELLDEIRKHDQKEEEEEEELPDLSNLKPDKPLIPVELLSWWEDDDEEKEKEAETRSYDGDYEPPSRDPRY